MVRHDVLLDMTASDLILGISITNMVDVIRQDTTTKYTARHAGEINVNYMRTLIAESAFIVKKHSEWWTS